MNSEEKRRIKYLISHIEKVIRNNTDSASSTITKMLEPLITGAIMGLVISQTVIPLIGSFFPGLVGYLQGWILMITGGILDWAKINPGVPINTGQLKKKIIEYIPETIRETVSNTVLEVFDKVHEEFGTEEYVKAVFGFEHDEIKTDLQIWQIFAIIKNMYYSVKNRVKDLLQYGLKKVVGKDALNAQEKKELIIYEYLENIKNDTRREYIAKHFSVECPDYLSHNEIPLTIKDTIEISFPPKLLQDCHERFTNIYQALFDLPMLIRLHLLLWFINLPNHLKIEFYFEYHPENEMKYYYDSDDLMKRRVKGRITQFFLSNHLVELVNMNQTTFDPEFANYYYTEKAKKRCDEKYLGNIYNA